jgi:hypothetical protein
MNAQITNVIILIQHLVPGVLGALGNLLVLIVYMKNSMENKSLQTFIIHLAGADLVCCLVVIPLNCYHELYIGRIKSDFLCKSHLFLNIVNITYSCFLMTLVAFERYVSVVYHTKKILTTKRIKLIMVVLFVLSSLLGAFGFASVGIYHKVHRIYAPKSKFHHATLNISRSLLAQSPFKYNLTSFNKSAAFGVHKPSAKGNPLTIKAPLWMQLNLATSWMDINVCSLNNKLVPIRVVSYMRILQNSLLILSFIVISVLYVLLFVFIVKRMRLKKERDQHRKLLLSLVKKASIKKNDDNSKQQAQGQTRPESRVSCAQFQVKRFSLGRNLTATMAAGPNGRQPTASGVGGAGGLLRRQNLFSRFFLTKFRKTFVLFIATMVMFVTFTPSLLTSLQVITYSPFHWNIVFINNAINPIIYSFLNADFRKNFRKTFKSCCCCCSK